MCSSCNKLNHLSKGVHCIASRAPQSWAEMIFPILEA